MKTDSGYRGASQRFFREDTCATLTRGDARSVRRVVLAAHDDDPRGRFATPSIPKMEVDEFFDDPCNTPKWISQCPDMHAAWERLRRSDSIGRCLTP